MSNDDETDDDHGVAPIPLVPPPPAGPPVDGVLDLGRAPDVQRLQPPSADAQRVQPDTLHEPQRLGRESVDAQRSQPNIDAQRANPVEHTTDAQRVDSMEHAADVQRAGSDVRKANRVNRARSFRHLRPRTRFLIAAGAAVAAGGGSILIVNAQDDDTPAAAPTTSVVITVETTDPPAVTAEPDAVVVTEAPTTAAATTIAPTTIAETTIAPTTIVETTLVPTTLAASVAGTYSVLVTDAAINSSVTGVIPVPQQPADEWILSGPCDGIGTCTMASSTAALSGAPPESGADTFVVMSPSGPNAYAGAVDLTEAAPDCGAVSGAFTVSYGGGAMSGTYLATFSGSGDCPPFTVSANFSGTLVG